MPVMWSAWASDKKQNKEVSSHFWMHPNEGMGYILTRIDSIYKVKSQFLDSCNVTVDLNVDWVDENAILGIFERQERQR